MLVIRTAANFVMKASVTSLNTLGCACDVSQSIATGVALAALLSTLSFFLHADIATTQFSDFLTYLHTDPFRHALWAGGIMGLCAGHHKTFS